MTGGLRFSEASYEESVLSRTLSVSASKASEVAGFVSVFYDCV